MTTAIKSSDSYSQEEKEIYFIVLSPIEMRQKNEEDSKKVNFKSKYEQVNILSKKIEIESKSFIKQDVYKLKISENEEKIEIEYRIEDYIYAISFILKSNSFYFDVTFEKRHYFLTNLPPEEIKQDVISYHNKLQIFLDALKENKESNKISKLYEEAISLYKENKDFNLLIFLFLQVYKINDLCTKLINTFNKIKVLENIKIDKSLVEYLETFNQIFENDDIIETNGYNKNDFYGIILCYLYYYDINNKYFSKNINLLYKKNREVLFEILIKFQSYFLKPLNQDIEFYNQLIGYSIQNKELKITEKVLKYIKDLEIFLIVINKHKNDIIDYFEKPIKVKSELKLEKKNFLKNQEEVNEIVSIIELIKEIISYSENQNKLLLYLTSQFWTGLLNQYKIPDEYNIDNCYKLRKLFKEYYKLIINIYKDVDKQKEEDKDKYKIKKEIKRYYERDEFGFILNKIVKEYLSKSNEVNSHKLAWIQKYNPYFNIEDEDDKKRFVNYKDTSIFDFINFSEADEKFIRDFCALKFEEVFNENIKAYLIKMVSKITDIQTFGTIFKLVNIEKRSVIIKNEYYDLLKNKYEYIMHEMESLKDEKLTKAIEISCLFITKIFLFENEKNKNQESQNKDNKNKENKCEFLKKYIDKLDNNIKSLIYNELMKINKGDEFKEMKDYIFKYFIDNLDDADNIIKLISNLSDEDDKKKFFKELIEKCKFTKEQFFFEHGNKKIKLLSDLNKKLNEIKDEKGEEIIKLGKELLGNELDFTLDQIRKDLDSNSFSKNKIEEILKSKDNEINRDEILKKLGLIKIVISDYNPREIYDKLNEKVKKMNDTINELNGIKKSLSIFHQNRFRKEINDIADIIDKIETRPMNEFDSEDMRNNINRIEEKKGLSQEIDKVKNILIFKILFKNSKGADQEVRFSKAKTELDRIKHLFKNYQESLSENNKEKREQDLDKILENKIFDIIKDELSKKEDKEAEEFITQMIKYFDIKDKQLDNDLNIFFKCKKYEIDIKSIKYFFDTFLSQKLRVTKFIDLSKMKKLKDVKSALQKLKKENIYDYESKSYYFKIYTSLYNKREALDFLMEKITNNTNLEYLKTKLNPTQRRINIKHIEDTIYCLKCLSDIINKDEKEILKYIKNLDNDKINKFISYSKIYEAIKELDDNDNSDDNDNITERVDEIIQDSYLEISTDTEKFSYKKNKKTIDIDDISELIKLKNQINIKEPNENNKKENIEDVYEVKCRKLLFFKNLISDLEEIYDKIKILRTKGCYLPITITIEIEFPKSYYCLDNKVYDKEDIKEFLFNVKIDFEKQLNKIYRNEQYLRFLYGKLFRNIQKHIYGSNIKISGILRYIFNITDNNKEISDLNYKKALLTGDYYTYYSEDNDSILKNISGYILSLFNKNNLDLEKHYKKMLIKDENSYKGFYFKECKEKSMEEYIIDLFYDKLGKEQLPISQNILICSKETSIGEIQSFLYRAILCDYNTLFVFEIVGALSDFQYNNIYNYIDKILTIKLEKYKNEKNNSAAYKIKIEETKEYLDSFVVFVYNNSEVKNNLKYLENYSMAKLNYNDSKLNNTKENIGNSFTENNQQSKDKSNTNNSDISLKIKDNFDYSKFSNVKIITSDVCGLGKSYKIKKQMKDLKYYHFPLGGKLSKKIIYTKLSNLIEKINEDKNEIGNKKIGIHIDLSESEEISLITEFLFSILITNFYIYNEDIIYFPNDFYIYIEIPNCFGENYLSKIGILNRFKRENIVLGELKSNDNENITNIKMDDLQLSEEIKDKFKNMLGIKGSKEIEEYVKNNMGIKEYSFHHILTFINLFISQHREMGKIEFKDSYGNDITEKCKKNFAETTKYFTNGGFARLLMMKNDNNETDKFDLYSKAYNSDSNNKEFKTVFYLDSKTKKYNFIDLGETQEQEKKNKREVDIIYLVDATGSMGPEINAANQHVIRIFNDLKAKYKEKDFNFGVVFYRDQAYATDYYTKHERDRWFGTDESGIFQLTNNMENLKRNISTIEPNGGWGYGGDWVEGYEFTLNKINWREGLKLIIHIADDGAHGEEFTKGDPLPEEGPKLIKQINKVVEKNINIVAFKIGNDPKQSFEKTKEVYDEHKILKKKNNQFMEIYEFNRGNDGRESSNEFLKLVKEAIDEVADPSYFYLKRLKQLLNLPNDINNDIEIRGKEKLLSLLSILNLEKEDYVITDDNFKKMVLLIYRIQANVPVIIMGETGCGKTALITKLNQIINNGKKLLGTIKVHPGINDEIICEEMRKMNKSAKEKQKEGKEQWVFFDEINTCSSLTLLKEIFINRTFNGEKLEDNIRLIGACNPYRKKLNTFEKYGLSVEDDKDDKDNNLVYKVQPLPQSLLYYTFSFGSITKEDEKKYIKSITRELFNMYDEYEKKLHEFTTDAISECHEFLRESFGEKRKGEDGEEKIIKEPSIVSLRDMNRFKSCVKFFQDYFLKKYSFINKSDINQITEEQKKVNKIKSIICSIYLCYYIRIIDKDIRNTFNTNKMLRDCLFKLVNVYSGIKETKGEEKSDNILENIKYKPLVNDIQDNVKYPKKKERDTENENENETIGKLEDFSVFLKIEEGFLLNHQ